MEMADLLLYLAIVLVLVVFLAIPRMMVANQESVAALYRQQVIHHHVHAHAHVRSIHSQREDQHQRAAAALWRSTPIGNRSAVGS